MCKIIIHSEGSIEKAKISPALSDTIRNEIHKISPDANVTVNFRITATAKTAP